MSTEEPRGSFVRWQAVTIGQLTYAINLVLTFSVATLGFQVTMLGDKNFALVSWQKCVFGSSLLLLALAVAFGVAVVINRLRAFRATMRAARAREKRERASVTSEKQELAAVVEEHRTLYRKLDKRTWWLFWWQIGTFGGGITLTVLSLLAVQGNKLL